MKTDARWRGFAIRALFDGGIIETKKARIANPRQRGISICNAGKITVMQNLFQHPLLKSRKQGDCGSSPQ
jgi:hypothetical protein